MQMHPLSIEGTIWILSFVNSMPFSCPVGVRIAAAESLPYLLECAKIRGPEYIANMWQFICPELLKAVDTEPESDIKSEHMHSLAQVNVMLFSICGECFL